MMPHKPVRNENDTTKSAIDPPLGRHSPQPFLNQKMTPSPYLHPPPPKPLVGTSSSKFLGGSDPPSIAKSATTSLDSARLASNGAPGPKTSLNNNHVPPTPPSYAPGVVGEAPPGVPLDTSATDTSDDEEGIFHKLSPSFWSKFIGNSARPREGQKSPPTSAKSNFFTDQGERRSQAEERGGDAPSPSSPAGSPRPFSKAFGRFKLGTKVAANFKSYLKGDKVAGGEDPHAGRFAPHCHPPLQKSASSGPSVGVFSQVVHNYQYPLSIPKKPAGPRDAPSAFSADLPTNSVNRPRQQYL